jgi:hypothetical protein
MIAEAIRDSLPNVAYVGVRTNGITVTQRRKSGGSIRSHFMVPLKAARALVKFDAGEVVRPFVFTPKLVDRIALTPVTPTQRKKNAIKQRAKRATRKAQGKRDIWRLRIAGL